MLDQSDLVPALAGSLVKLLSLYFLCPFDLLSLGYGDSAQAKNGVRCLGLRVHENAERGPGSVTSVTRSLQGSGGFHDILAWKGHMCEGKVHMCVFVWVHRGINLDQEGDRPAPQGQVFKGNTTCTWDECHSGLQSIGQEILFPWGTRVAQLFKGCLWFRS